MDEWKAEIDKIKAKADKAEADAQIGYNKQIEDLRLKQEAAQVRRSSESSEMPVKTHWKILKQVLNLPGTHSARL